MEANMCVIKEIGRFLKKGADTFREASQGRYYEESEAIDELKKEMFGKEEKRSDDKANLLRDRRSVEGDVCKSLTNLVIG